MFGLLKKEQHILCSRVLWSPLLLFLLFLLFPLIASEFNQLITIMYIYFIISKVFVHQKERNNVYLWGRYKGCLLY